MAAHLRTTIKNFHEFPQERERERASGKRVREEDLTYYPKELGGGLSSSPHDR
jgi:hypothetical protein